MSYKNYERSLKKGDGWSSFGNVERTKERLAQLEELSKLLQQHQAIFDKYEEKQKFIHQVYRMNEGLKQLSTVSEDSSVIWMFEALERGSPFEQELQALKRGLHFPYLPQSFRQFWTRRYYNCVGHYSG